jgi:hypothetical protein
MLSNNNVATTSRTIPRPWAIGVSSASEMAVNKKVRSSIQTRYPIPVTVALCPEKMARTRKYDNEDLNLRRWYFTTSAAAISGIPMQ